MISGAIEFNMFLENSSSLAVTFNAGEGVTVPQGTVHYARNAVCNQSEIVVVFDHPDPATVYVGQALAQFPLDYLDSAFVNSPGNITHNQFILSPCNCNAASG